ncbi:hypothetical protein ABIB94_004262 [Bradyrhizobium sp. JR7.2]|uniref:hypothetical protein n=1 Tax=unclassified Bradyrhizobium TaxID=2631580 RepID=UPI0007C9758A|nr:hypothetical protein [Bradyrhizobium sp.]
MVQIRKQQERGFIGALLINCIPDVVIAWAASSFFNGDRDVAANAVLIFLALQVIYFAVWLRRIVWGWLLYWVSNRRKMTEHLEDFLHKQRFPCPPEVIGGVDDYLAGVADNSKVSAQVRLKAATELGVLAGIRAAGNGLYAMQLAMAYERALQSYERRFAPREPNDEQWLDART